MKRLVPLAVVVVLATVPFSAASVPGLLPGPVNSPGSLRILALCLVFAALAAGYDLLFGRTGLLSFGHALHVAAGSYTVNIAVTKLGWSLPAGLALAAAVGVALPLLIGAVSVRVTGIAFAMVTLAFAQAGSILAQRDPGGWTGGEEGLSLRASGVPDLFLGVTNTVNLYWLALAFLIATVLVIRWANDTPAGRLWAAIRENERRVAVLGVHPYRAKLLAYVLAGFLGTAGGVVHLLVSGGSNPELTTSALTLSLLVMVVLGGTGSRWGAIVGGALYTFLDLRLGELSTSETLHGLPAVLRVPLTEPLFVLGTLFIIMVYALPHGLAGIKLPRRAA
ncbi:branched-chain amino acid ABC transporter permease [Longispora fulva]|uniref:Branched-chain amino acid transport system permease protein n=1 Tax=Longispora fulva TaxID=619741 RepID=A0A8J7KI32_9ACTN|nr:branched-chain amino acid ABC transporter permease [Longispora fulva]MBG6135799.1 branched-chain amino acid transport system permease protein [Longispora fulva]GIG55959.1 branched-chain amino acid ABC transporter permease [Longispora fulva]